MLRIRSLSVSACFSVQAVQLRRTAVQENAAALHIGHSYQACSSSANTGPSPPGQTPAKPDHFDPQLGLLHVCMLMCFQTASSDEDAVLMGSWASFDGACADSCADWPWVHQKNSLN